MWRALFHVCFGGLSRTSGPPGGHHSLERENEYALQKQEEEDTRRQLTCEINRLHQRIRELGTLLDLERAEHKLDLERRRSDLDTRTRQMAEQMRTCLARISDLERVNGELREDAGIAMRREKSFAGQLAMLREELDRRETEKKALISSLETALSTIYKLKSPRAL